MFAELYAIIGAMKLKVKQVPERAVSKLIYK
jgi:hypothetical protein